MKRLFGLAALIAAQFPLTPTYAQTVTATIVPVQIDGGINSLFVRPLPPRPLMLPDGIVSISSGSIRYARLTHPTTRYAHGVIGDAIEAGGLAVETENHAFLTLTLGADAVFEDRIARIVRLDSEDGVLVVKSYLERGAALAFVRADSNAIRIVAESAAIGTPHRWLNPIGIADFDGDGRDEIAAILTPHIGGQLTLYRQDNGALREAYRIGGFSNHSIGSRELGWSAIVDANGDGTPDIVVPDTERHALRIVTFAGGRFAELARVSLPAALASSLGVATRKLGGKPEVFLELADRQTYVLHFVN